MRFVQGWVTRLLSMHAALPEPEHACITGYPVAWGEVNKTTVPVMCDSRFRDDGIIVLKAGLYQPSPEPREVPFAAAGFLFSPGRAIVDCPFDPDLPELFHGEEILYSARLWTHGYRLYTPSHNVLFHHYTRQGQPKYFDAREPALHTRQRATHAKLHQLLAGGLPGYRFGFAQMHTLQQCWNFSRIDLVARTSETRAVFCGDSPKPVAM